MNDRAVEYALINTTMRFRTLSEMAEGEEFSQEDKDGLNYLLGFVAAAIEDYVEYDQSKIN